MTDIEAFYGSNQNIFVEDFPGIICISFVFSIVTIYDFGFEIRCVYVSTVQDSEFFHPNHQKMTNFHPEPPLPPRLKT